MKRINIDKNFFSDYFKKEFTVFKLVGIDIIGRKEKRSIFYNIYAPLVSFGHIILLNFLQIVNLFTDYEDPFLGAFAKYTLLAVSSSVNLCILYKSKRIIRKLLFQISDSDFLPQNPEQLSLLKKYLKFQTTFKYVFIIFTIVAAIIAIIRPVFVKEKVFPAEVLYPFDPLQSPIYETCYIHQIIGVCSFCVPTIYLEIVLVAVVGFIGLQCDMFSCNLENIEDDLENHMKKCVYVHKKILR